MSNTLWSGRESGSRLYYQSGQFSSTIKDSLSVSAVDSLVYGISWDGTDSPWCGSGDNKLYKQSGRFSSTLKTSLDVSGVDNDPVGISSDGTDTPWAGSEAEKLYLQSGQFSSTLKTSFSCGAVVVTGISYDGANTPWVETTADRFFLQSGQFSSTIKDSLDVTSIDTNPQDISWDGTDTPWIGGEVKLYLQSGQFSSTLKTSLDLTGIDTAPTGIEDGDYTARTTVPPSTHWAKILTANPANIATDDYCKLTANDVTGRSYSEVKEDLDLEIGTDVQAWDAGLDALAALTYASDSFIKVTATDTYAIRTIAETKTDLSLNLVENTAHSTDAHTMTIDGVDVSVHAALNIHDAVADTTDTSCWVGLFEDATGDIAPKTDGGLTYNAGTAALSTTTFIGALTGQADTVGTITGLAPDTATTQATQGNITSCANLATVGTITTGVWNAGAITSSGVGVFEGASVTIGKASTTTGTLVLHDSGSANTITLTVPNVLAGSLTFTLPPTDGANTNVLQTDGNGVLTWAAVSGANHAILDGSVHTDSVADGVTRGSIIYGNATPKWDELVIGGANTFLGSDGTDVSYRTAAQVKTSLSLNLVENTAISTWAGAPNPIFWHMLTCEPDAVGAGTWASFLTAAYMYYGHFSNTASHNDGDNFTLNFRCAAGTYDLTFNFVKASNRGVVDVYFDASEEDSFDGYAAVTDHYNVETISGVTLTAGAHTLKFQIDGKHASSSDHVNTFQGIQLLRTA